MRTALTEVSCLTPAVSYAEPPVRADILPLARFGMQARESLRRARPPCGSLSPFAALIEPILSAHVFSSYGQAES